jgi:hypothetical protein
MTNKISKYKIAYLKQFQSLTKCCKNPIADYFSKEQKLACNAKKQQTKLFSSTKEYFMHTLQHAKTNVIDFQGTKFGKILISIAI